MSTRLNLIGRTFCAFLLTLSAQRALGGGHTWRVNEIFSNADGTIQFIEVKEFLGGAGETATAGHNVTSNTRTFTIPANVPPPTSFRHILIATPAFVGLPGAPTPDYVLPAGSVPFLNQAGPDTIRYVPYCTYTFGAGVLPTNGVNSITITTHEGHAISIGPNSPTNYAGQTGSINVGCVDNAQCADGQFCNGDELCSAGACGPGSPPICPPGADPQCTSGACDSGANGGAGGCVVVNQSDGTPCMVGGEADPQCDNSDVCVSGACSENFVQSGTPCDDANPATAGDRCNGSGACFGGPGCGSCRLYTDLVEFYCIGDVGDILIGLTGFAESTPCSTLSASGLTPGSIVWDGGCWQPCQIDADCVSALGPGVCVAGQCCDVCDISEILAKLDAFAGIYACPHVCPPGACEVPAPDNCCRDGSYFDANVNSQGTTETDCFFVGGTYLGNYTTCSVNSGLPLCPNP